MNELDKQLRMSLHTVIAIQAAKIVQMEAEMAKLRKDNADITERLARASKGEAKPKAVA